jgi:hypothetical protein
MSVQQGYAAVGALRMYYEGHGHTAWIDRPYTLENSADDIAADRKVNPDPRHLPDPVPGRGRLSSGPGGPGG